MRSLPVVALAFFVVLLVPLAAVGDGVDGWSVPVIDLSVHLPRRMIADDRRLEAGVGQASTVRMRRGGVRGVVMPIEAPRRGRRDLADQDLQYRLLSRAIYRSDDFHRGRCGARPSGSRIDVWLSLRGAGRLAERPAEVGLWIARGVRIFGLVGEEDNALAPAATRRAPAPLTGLSEIGRDVVERIFRAGGLVDIVGMSDTARDDVLAMAHESGGTVIASSAGARALADDPRNLTSTQIHGIAMTGGVIGVSFDRHLVAPGRLADVRHVVRHIRHMIRLAGVDHVAIGSGFESGHRPARRLESASDFPVLARRLRHEGLSQSDVERVFWKNAERVLCDKGRR